MIKVYLAGGMQQNWREEVKKAVKNIEWLDPTTHYLSSELAYTTWDLNAIAHSDILFAYLEADNASGVGMALEMGYAYALGKKIIFIEQNPLQERTQYFGMSRIVSDFYTNDLQSGIAVLAEMSNHILPC